MFKCSDFEKGTDYNKVVNRPRSGDAYATHQVSSMSMFQPGQWASQRSSLQLHTSSFWTVRALPKEANRWSTLFGFCKVTHSFSPP